MEIGNRIAFFRKSKNYTVNKLATMAGISQSYLREVKLSNKNPTVEVLSYICDALGISLLDFFNDETQTALLNDPLLARIYQLTPSQRNALLDFLNTL